MKRLALLALLLAPSVEAAIAFRSIGTVGTSTGGGGGCTAGTPAGVVSTDVVVLVISFGGSVFSAITPPTGWTLAKGMDNVGTGSSVATYWALGSVASYAFGTGGVLDAVACIAAAYSGVDNVTPMDATAVAQNNTASTTVTSPSITSITNAAEIVFLGTTYDAARGGLGTWTQVFATLRGSGGVRGLSNDTISVAIADASQGTAGASGTKTETFSVSLPSQGVTAALRPSGGAAATPQRTLMGVGQ